jgi:hypothetical protein
MRRIPWVRLGIMLALLVGLGVGLVYAWMIAPRGATDTQPRTLRADFKDQYRSLIAAAYAATGNLPRARARLALLGDPDSVEALNGQAQRMQANNQSFERADQVAALAQALDENASNAGTNGGAIGAEPTSSAPVPNTTVEIADQSESIITATSLAPSSDVPLDVTETPQIIETSTIVGVSTPRPTNTATPVPGKPFKLTGQETVCDPNLPNGLLQVLVLNSNRRQIAGVEIDITWDGGEEQFFTGLKPELGNGYADYMMSPDIIYSIQLARGSDVAAGITAPSCHAQNGETFPGGIKLTFQQP